MEILIVEDEQAISDLIAMNMKLVGYNYTQAYDGQEALESIKKVKPDLVLLDVMIPKIDGFKLMENRYFKDIPVIFLTAKSSLIHKVKGLKLGADDYITKPFDTVELLARIEAVLRRTQPKSTRIFKINNTTINLDERTCRVNNKIVNLTHKEFSLLEILINNRNIALSRERLLDLAWGCDFYGDTRTVDVHITKLRKKLSLENNIKTVFKLGYRLEV